PPEGWDGTVPSQKLLSTVVRLQREHNQKFGAGHLIDILLGKQTARVDQYGHDSLSTFGIGTDLSEQEWRGVVRQLLAQGLLAVNSDPSSASGQAAYPTLVITEASADVLGGSRTVKLRREPERTTRSARKAKSVVADLPVEAQALFESLRAWRAAQAKEQGVPAYVIFHDATLRELATRHPSTVHELGTVTGVGESKLAKYGDQLLEVLGMSAIAAR
ncbi:MAG: RQC domain-containing protein, partial [Terrimesophilobacter sp.]